MWRKRCSITMSANVADALPRPEKRRSFKPRDVDNRFAEQAGRCKACRCDLNLSGFERDHIQRHDAFGKTDFDNLQLLCPACHVIKTKTDNFEAKKGARIRLEKGQQARRKAKGSQIKSRPTVWPKRKLQSRGFQK